MNNPLLERRDYAVDGRDQLEKNLDELKNVEKQHKKCEKKNVNNKLVNKIVSKVIKDFLFS